MLQIAFMEKRSPFFSVHVKNFKNNLKLHTHVFMQQVWQIKQALATSKSLFSSFSTTMTSFDEVCQAIKMLQTLSLMIFIFPSHMSIYLPVIHWKSILFVFYPFSTYFRSNIFSAALTCPIINRWNWWIGMSWCWNMIKRFFCEKKIRGD